MLYRLGRIVSFKLRNLFNRILAEFPAGVCTIFEPISPAMRRFVKKVSGVDRPPFWKMMSSRDLRNIPSSSVADKIDFENQVTPGRSPGKYGMFRIQSICRLLHARRSSLFCLHICLEQVAVCPPWTLHSTRTKGSQAAFQREVRTIPRTLGIVKEHVMEVHGYYCEQTGRKEMPDETPDQSKDVPLKVKTLPKRVDSLTPLRQTRC